MSDSHDVATPMVRAALDRAREIEERTAHLWEMTPAQRLSAFYRGEFNLFECLAWARRYPKEPPLAADGEWLFIAWKTPEWADADDARSAAPTTREREL